MFILKYSATSNVQTPISLLTWSHLAYVYDGTRSNVYVNGNLQTSNTTNIQTYTPSYNVQIGDGFVGNMSEVRVSNVARYTGTSFTVPSIPFSNNANTLLLLKSLGQQTGTTLEVQGRGLNSTSIGAGRVVQSYPPAPMSSYLLDTTGNTAVTYGQGKYVASASTDGAGYEAWAVFDKGTTSKLGWSGQGANYSYSGGGYTGSVTTVDTLGNSYAGDWLQIQVPVSVQLSSYSIQTRYDFAPPAGEPRKWVVIGSRDGVSWTLVDSQNYSNWTAASQTRTFTVGSTQAYNYYRIATSVVGNGGNVVIGEWTLNGTEESLCVTSDAKVGVGIANPQRALEVAGDLVVGGTVSGGNPLMYRNRIINGDMRIAQRGTSATVTNLGYYTVDRWYVYAVSNAFQMSQQTLAVSDTPYQLGFRNSVRFTSLTPANIEMGHSIEGYNIQDLNWGTSFGSPITISFWFRSLCTAGSVFSLAVRNASTYAYIVPFTINAPSTWQYYTATIPPPPNGTTWPTTNAAGLTIEIGSYNTGYQTTALSWNSGNFILATGSTNIMATAGNYIEFTGVQLEKGTVATPFEFRPYATELALCQRYYQVFGPGNTSGYNRFGAGEAVNTVQAIFVIPFQVPMRAAPSTFSNSAPSTFQLTSGASTPVATAISTSDGSPTSTQIFVTVASGLTAGYGVVCVGNNTTSAFIGFGAEL